ncbi:MarR family transcriptional regulator [Sphingobium sp. CR28]|uniref:MarR family transcriptional regulator n=1 Tax=Sphingobium sp. CR28 TaxID=3400272 RepID=UPI003FEEEF32
MAEDSRATVLICGFSALQPDLSSLAHALGQRVFSQVTLDELPKRLVQTAALDVLVLDLRGGLTNARAQDALIRANDERKELPFCRLVVLFDIEAIDFVFAELNGPECTLLCQPALPDIVTALAVSGLEARENHKASLSDVTGDADSSRLDKLSEEVRRLAATIERLVGGEARSPSFVNENERPYRGPAVEQPKGKVEAGSPPDHGEIRALIRIRRLRERFLPEDLFADPAWDMLLDLFAARLAGERVSVSSLCIAAAVPPSTALRWIGQLTDRGIFQRVDDPVDGRRAFIELSDKAAQALSAWAQAVRASGGVLGPKAS